MSFDVFVSFFQEGVDRLCSISAIDSICHRHGAKRTEFAIEFPDGATTDVYYQFPSTTSLTFNHIENSDPFFAFLFDLLQATRGVVYWGDGAAPYVADLQAAASLPNGMVAALGAPVVVPDGSGIRTAMIT